MPSSSLITISTSTILRFFAVALGLVAIYLVRDIVFSLFFAVIVASAIEPSILWLKQRGLGRIPAVILVYLGIAALAAFLVYLIVPLLAEELRSASSALGTVQSQFLAGIERIGGVNFGSLFAQNAEILLRLPSAYIGRVSGGVLDIISQGVGGLFTFALVVIFSFYLAAQEKGIENFLRLVTPVAYEPYVLDLWSRSQKKLGRWLQAQLLLGAVVGIFIFIGLTLLGIKQAFLFAALAALFEIIPVVGPILAAVPAVATAFLSSPILGLSTVALYVIVQQAESHIIVPVVMRRAVGLSPLVVVIALLVGAKLGGILGILLAVPLTAVGAELVNDWDKKKRALIPG